MLLAQYVAKIENQTVGSIFLPVIGVTTAFSYHSRGIYSFSRL
ncbi:MAG: hypothetical protein WCL54_05560 [Clostridia bacterium]